MKAIVFDNEIILKDMDKPVCDHGESCIRIAKAGICNTDIEITEGYMQYTGVIGHEFVGIVEETDDPALLNQRVVGEINVGCGKCSLCLSGMERHCFDRGVVGIYNYQGAFAEYLVLPNKNIKCVPDNVSDSQAVFVEPLAAALEILEQVHIKPDTNVAIVGDGKLALLILQVIKLTGAKCTVFGKHEEKLNIAKKLGASIGSQSNNEKYNVVVEVSGNPDGLQFARNLIQPRGTLVLKSTYAGKINIDMSTIVVDEVSIVGSRCGQFQPALQLLAQGLIEIDNLVAEEFNFYEYEKAFEFAHNSVLKVILNFN